MSGRGRGRSNHGRGRGGSNYGRGRSSSNNSTYSGGSGSGSKTTTYKPSKKSLSDYIYYLGSAKQAADYETTTEFLINHIKKTFSFGIDIGTALETPENVYSVDQHKPTLQFSKNKNDDVKEAENKQFEIEFKEDYSAFMKRKQNYETNTTKAYAFLWEQCAKGMQSKIESGETFSSKVKNNPLELLLMIKKHALNYNENRYEMSIMLESIRSLFSLRQKDGESLQDYTKRFKTTRDVCRSHIGGPIILTKYVEKMKDYDATKSDVVTSCQEKAFQQLLAYTYLDNSDKTKYGSLLAGLQTQQSLKNNQYPKTITEATNVLSNHRFDVTSGKKPIDKATKDHEKDNKNENSNKEEMPEMSFAMMEGKCYCCGKAGHKSPTCKLKDSIPKEN